MRNFRPPHRAAGRAGWGSGAADGWRKCARIARGLVLAPARLCRWARGLATARRKARTRG